MNKNIRSLYWGLILYDDSENLNFNDKIITIAQNYDYVYIKHDKDIDPNGNLKKIHYHIILKFNNYKWLKSLSDELNIPINYFEKINSLNNMLVYLIHYNNPDKYQYSLNDVFGTASLKIKLNKCISNIENTEEDKIQIILDFIYSYPANLSYRDLVSFVLNKGLWAEFRRSANIIFKLLDEHKYFISSINDKIGNVKINNRDSHNKVLD